MTDRWWHLRLACEPTRAELVADRCWVLGAAGIEERSTDSDVLLIAGFDDRSAALRAADDVADLVLWSELRPVEDDGLDAWRVHAEPVLTDRFVLIPDWQGAPHADVDPHRSALRLDPGRTFGSGSHPTTQACLDAFESVDLDGLHVLDVGTGSGVLAIAAAMAGAARVVGIDIDPTSPETARANAGRNGVSDRTVFSTLTMGDLRESDRFDLVIANVLAPVIRELASDLVTRTVPGGHLIVSGLLEDRHTEATDVLVALGTVVPSVTELDGWVAVTLHRPR